MKTHEFITESDAFVLAWNKYTADKGKKSRPIPVSFKRFDKISSKKPPGGISGHCYHNSLNNYKKHGLRMAIGFAVPKTDVERLLKTGELSWNPLYRGYNHAWNIDKTGAIVDSTYKNNVSEFQYYGIVVPEPTVASFKSDSDVEYYVQHITDQFDAGRDKSYEKYRYTKQQKPISVQVPCANYDHILNEKGFIFHSCDHIRGGKLEYLYISKKGGQLRFQWNPTTKEASVVSYIGRGQHGETPVKFWHSLDDYLKGYPGTTHR